MSKARQITEQIEKALSLCEGGLSKVQQAISDPNISFAIISACRGDKTEKENKERTKELMKDVGTRGFIKLEGGYMEDTEDGGKRPVTERSVLIKNISKEDALALGKKYDQDSILWKDENGMSYVYQDGTEDPFKTGERDLKVTDDIKTIGDYFSRRVQGGNKRNYFSMIPEDMNEKEVYLSEYSYHGMMSKHGAFLNGEPSSVYTRIL